MNRLLMRGTMWMCGAAAALLLAPATAQAQQLDKNAQFCEDFDQDVIIGGKIEDAPKYLTDDFKEHNVRFAANNLAEFTQKLQALRAARAGGGNRQGGAQGGGQRAGGQGGQRAGGGGGGRGAANNAQRVVFSHDDVVVFMRPNAPQPDPNNAGQFLPPTTHFDVYRLRNGKIAEHWD